MAVGNGTCTATRSPSPSICSPGCVQIHTGPVETLKTMGPWFNVLDPGFNLHLREDAIAHAWVVRKPTKDGIVTSLEIFDDRDRVIAIVFGKRKEGEPESEVWRGLLARLVPDGSAGGAAA